MKLCINGYYIDAKGHNHEARLISGEVKRDAYVSFDTHPRASQRRIQRQTDRIVALNRVILVGTTWPVRHHPTIFSMVQAGMFLERHVEAFHHLDDAHLQGTQQSPDGAF